MCRGPGTRAALMESRSVAERPSRSATAMTSPKIRKYRPPMSAPITTSCPNAGPRAPEPRKTAKIVRATNTASTPRTAKNPPRARFSAGLKLVRQDLFPANHSSMIPTQKDSRAARNTISPAPTARPWAREIPIGGYVTCGGVPFGGRSPPLGAAPPLTRSGAEVAPEALRRIALPPLDWGGRDRGGWGRTPRAAAPVALCVVRALGRAPGPFRRRFLLKVHAPPALRSHSAPKSPPELRSPRAPPALVPPRAGGLPRERAGPPAPPRAADGAS